MRKRRRNVRWQERTVCQDLVHAERWGRAMSTRSIASVAALWSLLAMLTLNTPCWAGDVIELGFIAPRSGPMKAAVRDLFLEGAEFAVEDLNDRGGLLGRRVLLIPIDSTWRPDVALKNVKKAMQEHDIKFFACAASSQIAKALSIPMEEHNALWYSGTVATTDLTSHGASHRFFLCNFTLNVVSKAMASEVAQRGFKRVFIIAPDYPFGHQSSEVFITTLQEQDPTIEVVGKYMHPLENKDFAPCISQLIDSGAEIALTPTYGVDLVFLLKTAARMGYKGKFACCYLNSSLYMTALGDDAVAGHVTSAAYLMSIPTEANQSFVERFYQARGYYPEGRGMGYVALMFWAEAVKQAGSTEVDEVIKVWEGLSYDGLAGRWTMRASDHQAVLPIWTADIVRDNPYFDHAYPGAPTMLSAEEAAVPVEETRSSGLGGT